MKKEKLRALETELTEACDLKQGELLLDIPKALYATEATTEIICNNKPIPIEELSPLLKAMRIAQWSYWNIGVYCDKKNRESVGKIAQNVLLGFVQ